jgi:hypothetical protein
MEPEKLISSAYYNKVVRRTEDVNQDGTKDL